MGRRRSWGRGPALGDGLTRQKVLDVFKEMRNDHGFVALAAFMCCGNCAGAAIADRASARVDAGKKPPNGALFWTNQEDSRWDETGVLHLNFGRIHTEKHGELGWDTVKAGEVIHAKLLAAGVYAEWDGNEHSTIIVSTPARVEYDKIRAEQAAEVLAKAEAAKLAKWDKEDTKDDYAYSI